VSRGLLFWLLVGQVDPDSGGGGRRFKGRGAAPGAAVWLACDRVARAEHRGHTGRFSPQALPRVMLP